MSFPIDDVTLAMLEAACTASDVDDGATHLAEFLQFGAEELAPYEAVTEDGEPFTIRLFAGGYHPNDVILALIAEVRRLRNEPPHNARGTDGE